MYTIYHKQKTKEVNTGSHFSEINRIALNRDHEMEPNKI